MIIFELKYAVCRLCGAVLDSCPGPISCVPNIAYLLGTKTFHDRPLAFYPFPMLAGTFGMFQCTLNKQSLWTAIKQTLKLSPRSKTNYESFGGATEWPGPYMRYDEDETWPLLFLYSKTDQLLPYTYIEKMIDLKKRQNSSRCVQHKRFDKVKHVMILPKYPKEYQSEVSNFISKVVP